MLNDGAQARLHRAFRAFNRVSAQRLLRLAQKSLIDLNRGLHGVAPRSQTIDTHTITGIHEPVAQTLRSPFDGLRANGIGVESIGVFPFVLSLSKHENGFVQQAPILLGVSIEEAPISEGTGLKTGAGTGG